MPFVLTLVDADGNLTESTLTLNRLRAEVLPQDLKTGVAGLHDLLLTPEPTEDEKFLFNEFTKLIERFDPLAGIHSAETALAVAIEATNARIAERLSKTQDHAALEVAVPWNPIEQKGKVHLTKAGFAELARRGLVRCKVCESWDTDSHYCNEPKLNADVSDRDPDGVGFSEYPYHAPDYGPDFGCIHFKPRRSE